MTTWSSHILMLAMASAGCGDPLLFAKGDEQRFCVASSGQPVDAADGGSSAAFRALVDGAFPLGVIASLTELGKPDTGTKGIAATLTLVSLTALRTDGGVDLSGITGGRAMLLEAQQGSGVALPGQSLTFTATSDQLDLTGESLDLLPYLSSTTVDLRLDAQGALPTSRWTADLSACFRATFRADGLTMLGF
jgi:hypothetical protein